MSQTCSKGSACKCAPQGVPPFATKSVVVEDDEARGTCSADELFFCFETSLLCCLPLNALALESWDKDSYIAF